MRSAKVDRLNLAQLVMLYTRKFEPTDPREALNYYYVLRQITTEGRQSLFQYCTSELVRTKLALLVCPRARVQLT